MSSMHLSRVLSGVAPLNLTPSVLAVRAGPDEALMVGVIGVCGAGVVLFFLTGPFAEVDK